MAKTIQQINQFKTKPGNLFKMYADSKLHSEVTGGKASVGSKAGGSFSAHGGKLKGRILHLVKNKLIVQTWRAADWKKTDADSVLTLIFEESRGGAQVRMIHANVPDHDFKGVTSGWKVYYWDPWKKHLEPPKPAAKKAKKSAAKKSPARKKTAAKKPASTRASAQR